MSEISFYRLGEAAESLSEALRLQKLYAGEGVDNIVWSEFESEVLNFKTLSSVELSRNIQSKYNPIFGRAIGFIAMQDGHDIGMSIAIIDAHQYAREINVSAWILREYRNKECFNQLLNHTVAQATEQTLNPELTYWHKRRIVASGLNS